ncbi:hypothetical protein EBB07_28530 [Paenibacillaceae bacterium]|nr:hypothetical protein EBB07_28530 [Paenibacillaceae bacterium]
MKIKTKRYKIELSLDELELIDGKVSEEAQKVIEEAKKESSYGFELPIMNEIIKNSEKTGMLKWKHKYILSCDYCDKKSDYKIYPRSSRNHNKGDKNYNKPIYYSGIIYNEGFITIQGLGDMCQECSKKYNITNRLIDYIIDNDLKIEIIQNDYMDSKYLKDDISICYNCSKEMLESQMSRERTLMGDGTYPSGCPHCKSKSLPFGRSHNVTNRFAHVLNPEFNKEIQEIKKRVKSFNESVEKDRRIRFYQSKYYNTMFYIEEAEFRNGYDEIMKIDLKSKKFTVGYSWRTKCDEFKSCFLNEGYTEIEK